jgi:hypothetical protein
MSLTSRVANLFSGTTNSVEQDQSQFSLTDDGLPDRHINIPDVGSRRREPRSSIMTRKEVEEEEARPPYLHVRAILFAAPMLILTNSK